MQVPRITKIVVNIGLGEALDNAKAIEFARKRYYGDYWSKASRHEG